MTLQMLTFKKYKPFRESHEISIRPITLIIGRNNSGKSALVRLPLLLSSGFSSKVNGLFELNIAGVDFGSSVVDLIHRRSLHGSFHLGGRIGEHGQGYTFEYQIQHEDSLKAAFVKQLRVAHPQQGDLTLEWCGDESQPLKVPSPFKVRGQADTVYQISFDGLLFEVEGEAPELLTHFVACARDHLEHLQYKGPFRDVPGRFNRFPVGLGRNEFEILAADMVRGNGDLLKDVSDWYRKNMGGWELEFVQSGDQYSIMLRHPEHTGNQLINIVDTGAGIAQALPLVVQHFRRGQVEDGVLEIVEQPELHLHPAAHASMADLYVHAAVGTRNQFLIETHSEIFLLRLQYHVARGYLNPADVVVYWVDDRSGKPKIREITIDEKGDLSDWPKGVFSEAFDEVKRIRRVRQELD